MVPFVEDFTFCVLHHFSFVVHSVVNMNNSHKKKKKEKRTEPKPFLSNIIKKERDFEDNPNSLLSTVCIKHFLCLLSLTRESLTACKSETFSKCNFW